MNIKNKNHAQLLKFFNKMDTETETNNLPTKNYLPCYLDFIFTTNALSLKVKYLYDTVIPLHISISLQLTQRKFIILAKGNMFFSHQVFTLETHAFNFLDFYGV